MPQRSPRLCACGQRVPSGARCSCQIKRDQERKARFDKTRPSARQRGYTREWEKAAKDFLAANPSCRRCNQPATLVDHIQPHKGNQRLFWNRANWQPMCVSCHSGAKQAAERGSRGMVGNFSDHGRTGGGPTKRDFPETGFSVNGQHEVVQ